MALVVGWAMSVVLALLVMTDVPRRRKLLGDVFKVLLALVLAVYAGVGAVLYLL